MILGTQFMPFNLWHSIITGLFVATFFFYFMFILMIIKCILLCGICVLNLYSRYYASSYILFLGFFHSVLYLQDLPTLLHIHPVCCIWYISGMYFIISIHHNLPVYSPRLPSILYHNRWCYMRISLGYTSRNRIAGSWAYIYLI